MSDSDDIFGDIGVLEGDALNLSSPAAIDDDDEIVADTPPRKLFRDNEIVADTPPRKRARPRRPVFSGNPNSRDGRKSGWGFGGLV